MNDNKNEGFCYTYSASEQEEIKNIRNKYAPRDDREDKMERLRRLDASVTARGSAASLALGILGALMMGLGMSLAMTEIGDALGASALILGVVIGIVGIGTASLAYPLYCLIVRRERARIAPEILRLTDELMK